MSGDRAEGMSEAVKKYIGDVLTADEWNEFGVIKEVLYPALQQSKFTNSELNDKVVWGNEKEWITLPGRGKTDYDCGKVKYAVNCENHESCGRKATLHYYNCMNVLCPVCYERVCKREAGRITERVMGMGGVYKKMGVRLGRLKHIVISPPQKEWGVDFVIGHWREIRRYAVEILKKYAKDGFYGGVLIFHHARRKHEDGSSCENPECKRKHIWVWSPHFHYVGYGFLESGRRVYEETGWVVKNVDNVKGKHKKRNLFGTVFYLLTHRAVCVRREPYYDAESGFYVGGMYVEKSVGQGYAYVGVFGNCRGGFLVKERRYEVGVCEVCGGELHKYGVSEDEKINYDDDIGVYEIEVEIGVWYVNMRRGCFKWKVCGDKCERGKG